MVAAAASSIRHKTQDDWVLYFFGDGHPLRFLFPNLPLLKIDSTDFEVHGYIHNPARFDELEAGLKKLDGDVRNLLKDRKFLFISLGVGILALIKAYWVHIFKFLKEFCSSINTFMSS